MEVISAEAFVAVVMYVIKLQVDIPISFMKSVTARNRWSLGCLLVSYHPCYSCMHTFWHCHPYFIPQFIFILVVHTLTMAFMYACVFKSHS